MSRGRSWEEGVSRFILTRTTVAVFFPLKQKPSLFIFHPSRPSMSTVNPSLGWGGGSGPRYTVARAQT